MSSMKGPQTLNNPARPFHCPLCLSNGKNRTFPRRFEYNRHIKTVHENPRAHRCHYDGCDYAAGQPGNLKVHIMTYHSVMPKVPCFNAHRGCPELFFNYHYRGRHAKKCRYAHGTLVYPLPTLLAKTTALALDGPYNKKLVEGPEQHYESSENNEGMATADSHEIEERLFHTSHHSTSASQDAAPFGQENFAPFLTRDYAVLLGPGYPGRNPITGQLRGPPVRHNFRQAAALCGSQRQLTYDALLMTHPSTPPEFADSVLDWDCTQCVEGPDHDHKPWGAFTIPHGCCDQCADCVDCYYSPGGCFELQGLTLTENA